MTWPLTGRTLERQLIDEAFTESGRRGVALVGLPGVGTSRLLDVAVEHAATRGWNVRMVRATPAQRTVRFGALNDALNDALASFDADEVPDDRGLREFERHLRPGVAGGRLLLAVDDAHWLDQASISLVERLSGRDWARIALTIHETPGTTGEVPTPAMDLAEIEVGPLDRSAHDVLVESAFSGPMTAHFRQLLWEHTGGRPRDLQFMADALVGSDPTHGGAGLWRWDGTRLDSPGLRVLAAASLRGLTGSAREAFEIVAYAAPVPLDVVRTVIDPADLETLERAGLIEESVHDVTEASVVRPSRPIVGATVASRLSPATRRRFAATLASCHPPDDAWWRWRHASWADDAGLRREPTEFDVARSALDHADLALAERLCRSAVDGDPEGYDAHLLLAECLRRQGRVTDAMDALRTSSTLADSDDERVRVAVRRAQVATLLAADPDAAIEWLDRALAEVTQPAARARLERERQFTSAFVGQVTAVSDRSTTTRTGSDDTLVGDLLVTALLQALHLDVDGIDELLDRCRTSADTNDVLEPFVEARIGVVRHLAEMGRGRVGIAHEQSRVGLADAVARGEPSGLWAVCVAFSGPLVGDLEGAAAASLEADQSFRRLDPYGLRPFAAGIGASALLQAGRDDLASVLSEAASGAGADPRVQEMGRLRNDGWRAMLDGDLGRAAASAREAALAAIASGHRLWGAIALHEPARWGAAAVVDDDLADLAAEIPTPLVLAFHRHAAAAVAEHADGLDLAAERFGAMGCRALAAEAAAQASRRHSDEHAATRAATRADLWRASCSGGVPVSEPHTRSLTTRQREIARLAALGLPTRVIAEQLVLSSRTVDNHLRVAYQRLGVAGRGELSAELSAALIP